MAGKFAPPPPPPTNGGDGGGTAAPPDPNAAIISAATSWYTEAWGLPPPKGYIEKLVNQGMNLYEIQDYERHKPAFLKTEWAKKKADYIAQILNSILGR